MSKAATTIRVSQRGVITIPRTVREAYQLEEGDELTLLDLNGALLLKPGRSEIDALAGRIGKKLRRGGGDLKTVLKWVREEREKYGRRV